jgi:hypothetical protein
MTFYIDPAKNLAPIADATADDIKENLFRLPPCLRLIDYSGFTLPRRLQHKHILRNYKINWPILLRYVPTATFVWRYSLLTGFCFR